MKLQCFFTLKDIYVLNARKHRTEESRAPTRMPDSGVYSQGLGGNCLRQTIIKDPYESTINKYYQA